MSNDDFADALNLATDLAKDNPEVFAPLIKQLEDANTEQEKLYASIAVNIAACDELVRLGKMLGNDDAQEANSD